MCKKLILHKNSFVVLKNSFIMGTKKERYVLRLFIMNVKYYVYVVIVILCTMLSPCKPSEELITLSTRFGDIKLLLYSDVPAHKANFLALVKSGRYDSTVFHRVIPNFMIQGGDIALKPNVSDFDAEKTLEAEFVPKYFHRRGALAAARQGDAVNPEKRSSNCQFYIVQGETWTERVLKTDIRKLYEGLGKLVQDDKDKFLPMAKRMDSLRNAAQQNKDPETQAALEESMAACIKAIKDNYDMDVSKDIAPERIKAYTSVGGVPHLDDEYTVFGQVIEGMEVVDKIAALARNAADRPLEDVYLTAKIEKISAKAYKKYLADTKP